MYHVLRAADRFFPVQWESTGKTVVVWAVSLFVGRQKPPNSRGKATGFPYGDLWEEFGEPWDRLYAHGLDRDLIDRSFRDARDRGAVELGLTKDAVRELIAPLQLSSERELELTEMLYYLAGHYYSPRFHKLAGDSPAQTRRLLRRVASTARKLEALMSEVTPAVWRNVGGARWKLGVLRRASPEMEWVVLGDHLSDLANSAETVAEEFPRPGRGTTKKVLRGRWLRHSAEAIENATGHRIKTKVSDSAGRNYRFEGLEGSVFEAYCRRIDKGIATRTLVEAVRAYHENGLTGIPRKSTQLAI